VIPLQLAVAERAHAPVAPCTLPDGIQFVYVDDRGCQRAVALEEARDVDFGLTKPFREPSAYRRQRNFPGWWWSVTARSHIVYESWLERHYVIEADRDVRITGIAGQPFALTWPSGKREAKHVPDLCQLRAQGYPVREEDMARLSPFVSRHLGVHGTYTFILPDLAPGAICELRDPDAPDDDDE
jgi:hypothetical protein